MVQLRRWMMGHLMSSPIAVFDPNPQAFHPHPSTRNCVKKQYSTLDEDRIGKGS